ncbi:hypothetical protein KKE38_03000, partial [Candidatus Micrarchaeota archaeon]|nr:hypothetical protein [Candidatus Micrarchaeota archaeon]
IGMALAAYYFKGVMGREGITLKDCFTPYVPWIVIKDVLQFAIKTSIPGFTGNAVNLYVFMLYINNVKQICSFKSNGNCSW